MKTFTDYMREADALGIGDARRHWLVPDRLEGLGGCAIAGANIAALRVTLEDGDWRQPWAISKAASTPYWLHARVGICPACSEGPAQSRAHVLIQHLYGYHRWSRTQIADWLDATFGRDHDESDWLPAEQAVST